MCPPPSEGLARGVLLTHITDDSAVLCKAAPSIRNTYEIRLGLFMAKSNHRRFILAVLPETKVDASIVTLLQEHGGEIRRGTLDDYCVYVGTAHADGSEGGWTLGAAAAFFAFVSSLQSVWLRKRLRVGAEIRGEDLLEFGNELWQESVTATNIDGENIKEALLELMVHAIKSEGSLFFQ
jgi:hypothetical protein